MMRSMFSGVSGLRVHQTKMDVIANNIANVNTVGFKSSRVTFRDAFYQRIQGASAENPMTGRTGTNPMQIGLGTNVASIDSVMTQGLSQRTDNSTDIMLGGEGFFIVGDSNGTFFTRAGNVTRDANWNLNINGLALMGWDTVIDEETKEEAIEKGPVKPLELGGDKQFVPPSSTTMIDMVGNLNINDLPSKKDAEGNPYKEYAATMDFYDSAGNMYKTDVTFKYYEYVPGKGNANLQDHVKGFWTFEFKTADPNDPSSGVLVYPEGNKENPKTVAMHVGGTDSFNGKYSTALGASAGTMEGEFSPKGLLVFDTNGDMVGWDTLSIAPTSSGTGAGATTTFAQPKFADITTQVDALGLFYDYATGSVVGSASVTNSPITTMPTGVTAWRTLEGTEDKQMDLIIAPIDVLDPTATFGELTDDIPVTYVGEGATANAPVDGDNDGVLDENNNGVLDGTEIEQNPTDHVVRAGTMTISFADFHQWGGEGYPTEVKPDSVDGNEPGTLMDLSIASDGKITGRYSNGETKLLGQIAIAKFQNPAGLDRVGNNLFAATANSGSFNGTGSESSEIMSGSLEMSNVDLSQEFTEMITTQRGFQANSRTITVSDEMLQELVNLKR